MPLNFLKNVIIATSIYYDVIIINRQNYAIIDAIESTP